MKRFLLSIAAILLSAGLISAQEASLQQATELFNNGATAFSSNDKAAALDYFQKAYDMAKAIGDEGAEIVKNCSENIPKLYNSLATDLIKDTKYDEAIAQLEKAVAAAKLHEKIASIIK